MVGERTADSPLRVLADLLRQATGQDAHWAEQLTPAARLDEDLQLDSVELAALAAQLRQRYGSGVDLPAFLATLELDQLIALTVGDLLRLLPAADHARADATS